MVLPDSPGTDPVDLDRCRILLIRHLHGRFCALSHDDICDAVGDAFLLYLRSAPQEVRLCGKRTCFWLGSVARRRLWQLLQKRVSLATQGYDAATFGGRTCPTVDSRTVEGDAAGWVIRSLLSRLHPLTAETIRLYAIEEYRPREIAELLGCPVTTVKSRLKRGFRQLRKAL